MDQGSHLNPESVNVLTILPFTYSIAYIFVM